MNALRPAFIVPLIVLSALVVLFGVYLDQVASGDKDIREIPSALIDKPAPEFALPGIGGTGPGFTTGDLGGRVALVNVFASWCLPCRIEHPILTRLAAEGIPVYGINIRDKAEDARRFLDEFGNPYTRVGADTDGRVALDWGVYGYPETFVIDRDRRIRYRHVGPIRPSDLKRKIRPLIERLKK